MKIKPIVVYMLILICLQSFAKQGVMAEKQISEWDEILKGKWKAYDVEKSLYIESVKKTSAPDERAKFICDNLRLGDVPENLKKLYNEAVYGSDAKVKT